MNDDTFQDELSKLQKTVLEEAVREMASNLPHNHESNVARIGMRLLFLLLTDEEVIEMSAKTATAEMTKEEFGRMMAEQDQHKLSIQVDRMLLEVMDWVRSSLVERLSHLEVDSGRPE